MTTSELESLYPYMLGFHSVHFQQRAILEHLFYSVFNRKQTLSCKKLNLLKRIDTQDAVISKEIYEFFTCIRIKKKH